MRRAERRQSGESERGIERASAWNDFRHREAKAPEAFAKARIDEQQSHVESLRNRRRSRKHLSGACHVPPVAEDVEIQPIRIEEIARRVAGRIGDTVLPDDLLRGAVDHYDTMAQVV